MKEGPGYVDKRGEASKLCTARGKKTSRILGPHRAKVPLASGVMTSDDNDLATGLLSGSKDLDDGMQELAAQLMGEA